MTSRHINPELEQTKERVRPFLRRYLEESGIVIDGKGKFLCLNPGHDDHTPSMHFIKGSSDQRTKCFACGASYDIFDVHGIFHDRPRAGVGFVYQNVYELADHFGVEYQAVEPTEQELLYMQLSRLYRDAAETLRDMVSQDDSCATAAVERGIRLETCMTYGVGSVPWRAFVIRMQACGHDVEFMKQYDISKEMFDRDRLTFTLKDKNGMVVGFARRYLNYDKAADKLARSKKSYYPPKYYNTSANVPFFQREAMVYGLHEAKAESYRRFDFFEGYTDVLSARQLGLKNNGAGCGTGLTEYQVLQVIEEGYTHLNYVGDADNAGREAAIRFLDLAGGYEGVRCTITFLNFDETIPERDHDPDGFFRYYGRDAYLALPEYSAFDWKLDTALRQGGIDPYQLAKDMMPLILSEKDLIERGRLARTLAERTGVSDEDIRAELRRRTDEQVSHVAQDLERGLYRARDATEKRAVIQEAYSALSEAQAVQVDVSIEESTRACVYAFERFEMVHDGIRGWKTGWPIFDADFDGLPKEQQIMAIAGAPNCGKSALLTNLSVNLLWNNPSGISVIYHIMDDPRDIAFAKLMSCMTGIPIRKVLREPTDVRPYPNLAAAYNQAKEWLLEQLHTGRLLVKGQEMGTATNHATKLIDETTQKTGNRSVYMADSLHNIVDEQGAENERARYTHVSNWAKHISDTRRITMLFTCELTKEAMKGRPRLWMTAETRAIAYDFKAVGLLYNDLHVNMDKSQTFWVDDMVDPTTGTSPGQVRRPIIEIAWEKNKISEFKGTHYWKFWDNTARVEQMNFSDIKKEQEAAQGANLQAPNMGAMGSFNSVLPYAQPGLPSLSQGTVPVPHNSLALE